MSSLRLGTAVRDITPNDPAWLYGYGAREQTSTGVAEPISLSCLALSDGTKTVLLITCDLSGIKAHNCQQLCDTLRRETGIGFPDVLIAASHTHFAPALHREGFASPRVGIVEPDPRYEAQFTTKLLDAATASLQNLQPVQLQTARLQAPQVAFNRRTRKPDGSVQTNFLYPPNPDAFEFRPVDPELTVLRFKDDTGIKAVLTNFGCHPVTGGELPDRDFYRVSADYPYYLRQTVEEKYKCPVFFTLGAAGDAVPINRLGDCRQRIGSVLGNTILLAERTYRTEPDPVLKTSVVELRARTIFETNPGTAEAEYDRAKADYLAILDADTARDNPVVGKAAQDFNRQQTALGRSRLYPKNRFTIQVQCLQIGKTTLVAMPFEVLSEISLRMKKRCPDSVLVSCANGYQGYLPLAHEYPRGGYEASPDSTHFTPGTADRLLRRVLKHLTTVSPGDPGQTESRC
ncbi:MAG: hypothetical protein A3K19_06690 [Lentisphaerae bacterium RIFOXYB12_FULL_65_16]|nr:MAG: hypothetical protein A3K18_07810 [Lentisphaerae bacterium RIFOXYA12_64_32]OGV93126.1 MAG: hypothetical protein A3K19_06690 [Lentisphaerae bacterium RIFOXYB12_FULL_65_16]